jgi:hypothetical protein
MRQLIYSIIYDYRPSQCSKTFEALSRNRSGNLSSESDVVGPDSSSLCILLVEKYR